MISIGCEQKNTEENYLILFTDSLDGETGYKNENGETVIPKGKYNICFTDTFRYYAILLNQDGDLIAINREEKKLYDVFPFENGPDYASEGLFRIIDKNKIGYADASTGNVVIQPQFDCAYPFKNKLAKVSNHCKVVPLDEHSTWTSNNWYFIDKKGNKMNVIN